MKVGTASTDSYSPPSPPKTHPIPCSVSISETSFTACFSFRHILNFMLVITNGLECMRQPVPFVRRLIPSHLPSCSVFKEFVEASSDNPSDDAAYQAYVQATCRCMVVLSESKAFGPNITRSCTFATSTLSQMLTNEKLSHIRRVDITVSSGAEIVYDHLTWFT